jgi:hypothetical protein
MNEVIAILFELTHIKRVVCLRRVDACAALSERSAYGFLTASRSAYSITSVRKVRPTTRGFKLNGPRSPFALQE